MQTGGDIFVGHLDLQKVSLIGGIKLRAVLFALFILSTSVANATGYTVQELLPGAIAKAINNNGDVIGTLDVGGGFLLQGGNLTVLDGRPNAINDSGTVVGNRTRPDTHSSGATMWFPGVSLWGLFPSVSDATGVNSNGRVAGWSATLQGDRPFVWENSSTATVFRTLPTNGQPGHANCINNVNDVGGYISVGSNQTSWVHHPVIWSESSTEPTILLDEVGEVRAINNGGDFITTSGWYHHGTIAIQVLATDDGSLLGLNNLGQIVGHRAGVPFVWSLTSGFTDLPGGDGAAIGINDTGVIVGRLAMDPEGYTSKAVQWRIVPEPGTLLVLGSGVLSLLVRRQRR